MISSSSVQQPSPAEINRPSVSRGASPPVVHPSLSWRRTRMGGGSSHSEHPADLALFTKATLSPEHHQLSRTLPRSGEGGWTSQQLLFLALPRGCFPSRINAPTWNPWILLLVPLTVKLGIASRDLRATRAACLGWGEKEATGLFS